jgi:dihydroorotase
MNYLIKNGRAIDRANKIDDELDIFIQDGGIGKMGRDLDEKSAEIIDARNKIVAPGLVDMHAHLREPGREDEETILSGTRAAIRGGFTTVACMPNTEPAIDDAKAVKLVRDIIKKDALAHVVVIGAITRGRAGKALTDFKAMKKQGIVVFSDDGSSVEDGAVLGSALKEAKKDSVLIIEHCEDAKLSSGGVINKGFISTKMGLRGISRESEYERIRRDIELARSASSRIHIAHVSCRESVAIIRKAKKSGIEVTAETCPHYFALTEECCVTYDTNMKMNPPLRSREDAEAIKEGLADGTIDVIATDHAPHTDSEKDVEFDFAPFGIIGLETALSLAVMELIDKKVISWPELIARMSDNPAGILGLNGRGLKKGNVADITIIDPGKEYIYKRESIESKSRNSPFIDWKLKSRAVDVFVAGRLVMKDEVILENIRGK